MTLSRLTPPSAIALLLLALFPACDGASPPDDTTGSTSTRCTLIGCADAVTANFVDFTARFSDHLPATVSLCFDDRPCQHTTLALHEGKPTCDATPMQAEGLVCFMVKDRLSVQMSLGGEGMVSGGVHALRVQLLGADGEELLSQTVLPAFSSYRPNGPSCEPVCYSSDIDL